MDNDHPQNCRRHRIVHHNTTRAPRRAIDSSVNMHAMYAREFITSTPVVAARQTTSRRRVETTTRAIFKKRAPPVVEAPPPAKKSLFGGFGSRGSAAERQSEVRDFEYNAAETKAEAYARIRKQRAMRKAEFEAKEKGGLSAALWKVTRALDFQEDIESDRGLLSAARSMKKGDKMSTEQYGALRRKVGGTKSGFFGESVDVKGKYTDRGYVDEDEVGTSVLGQGFLGAVVVAVLATTVWVAVQVP
jgi:hypothetical protein